MKSFLSILLVICLLMSFSACDSQSISIKGDVEETVEVHSAYEDKGVSHPKNYTLITAGKVNTSRLGKQTIKYSVYSPDGELVKEMYRFVTVVDTTAPTYTVASEKTYYVGANYTVDDFIADYSDNHDDKSKITVSSNDLTFMSVGQHAVEITFTDSSNNSTTYTTNINTVLDIAQLLSGVGEKLDYDVHHSDTDYGYYTSVYINSNQSVSYWDSGSLSYMETVPTSLGFRAYIYIAADYGEFDKARVTINIDGKWTTAYSSGSATINAMKESVKVYKFSSTINKLELDTDAMLAELNQNLNTVLNNFKTLMKDTFYLELK